MMNKVEQGEQEGIRGNKREQGEQGGTRGNKGNRREQGEQGEQKSLDFEVILRQSCLFSQIPLAGFLKTLAPLNGPHFFRPTVFFGQKLSPK